jgi:hypothetical protein
MPTDVSTVRGASIIVLMMGVARTSETSVDIQLRRRQYIPEDSELHNRRRENFKSHTWISPRERYAIKLYLSYYQQQSSTQTIFV